MTSQSQTPSSTYPPKASSIIYGMWICLGFGWLIIMAPIPFWFTALGFALEIVGLVLSLICIKRKLYFHGVVGLLASIIATLAAYLIHFSILAYYASEVAGS